MLNFLIQEDETVCNDPEELAAVLCIQHKSTCRVAVTVLETSGWCLSASKSLTEDLQSSVNGVKQKLPLCL